MVTRDELLYRPDIRPPERETEYVPLLDDAALRDTEQQAFKEQIAEQLGIPAADIPADPFLTMKVRFQQLNNTAQELEARATFLLEKTIDDIDGYVGDAPPHILEYIEDLTGVFFSEETCVTCTVCGGAKYITLTEQVAEEYESRGIPISGVDAIKVDLSAEEVTGEGAAVFSRAKAAFEKAWNTIKSAVTANSPDVTGTTNTTTVTQVQCYACKGEGCIPQVQQKDVTSPDYSLDNATKQCIFRTAGFFDPARDMAPAVDCVSKFDGPGLRSFINNSIKKNSYFKSVEYGLKLLVTVLKMAYVIAVHYTVGYLCGMLDMVKPALNMIFGLGSLLVDGALKPLEKMLLSLVGYSCSTKEKPMLPCNFPTGQDLDIKRMNCCTMEPIFFGGDDTTGQSNFKMSNCFRMWIKQELDPLNSGKRCPCGPGNNGVPISPPTAEEMAKAAAVAEFLNNKGSRTGIMKPSDTYPLSRAIEASKSGQQLAQMSTSALDSSRKLYYTGQSTGPWDCFGFDVPSGQKPSEASLAMKVNAADQGKSGGGGIAGNPTNVNIGGTPLGAPLVEQGVYLFEYLKLVDEGVAKLLELADKAVIGTANLAKWGSSKELCCLVYILVFVSSMVSSMIKKGRLCPDMDLSQAMENELRWAANLKLNQDVAKFAQLLQIIKMIVDMFNRKMDRSLLLAGMQLPLQEMWNQIKMVIANGISQFLDILFAPLDTVLANFQSVPEIQAMIMNECFGIDKLFSFLSCMLGNLKFGMVNWVMSFLDFTISDIVIINDIYLSRTRQGFLESLSKLLGDMVNLLLGLQDCYEPKEVVNQILDSQMQGQYDNMRVFTQEIATTPAEVDRFDQCSQSLMNQSFIPSDDDIMAMDALQGSLSSTFGDISPVAESIIQRSTMTTADRERLLAAEDPTYRNREWWKATRKEEPQRPGVDFGIPRGYIPVAFTSFLDQQGELVSFGDFVKRMEQLTGTKVTEIRESMRYIFDILRGPDDADPTA